MQESGGTGIARDSGRQALEARTRARIDRAIGRARLVLLWEALWPRLAPLLVLFAVFAVLSWFGLWRVAPAALRVAILVLLAGAAIFCLARAARLSLPARLSALARVERASGMLHRPATAFADRLASAPNDPTAQALWAAHRERLLLALGRLKAGTPAPGLASRDPQAVRFLVLLLFVVGFVYAGPERFERLTEAFRGGETAAATAARIDAWVTPPAYTSRPPIFLTGDNAKPPENGYSVPAGSIVIVRTGGAHDLDVVSADQAGETIAPPTPASVEKRAAVADLAPPLEHRVTLSKAAEVSVRKGEHVVASWRFAVEPDSPPRVTFLKPPSTTESNALHLSYALEDDYGVVSASAEFAPIEPGPANAAARPLVAAPNFPLSLPQLRTRKGSAETIRDLTSHPWAGAKVRLTLVARDEAGQEGRSDPVEVTLPVRNFTNPIARAVVEQRANLALDANAAGSVADALDALTLAPENTIKDDGTYLTLRSAYYRLIAARSDDDLRGVVDYLWSIALGVEDGDMSLAAQDLRAAQEALRQALENGASDADIKKLTDQLRDAMQRYLQALAEEARRNPPSASLPPNPNSRTIRSQDLQRMLDRIENLARTGARDAARELLSQLQNMLENLQAGRPMQGNQANANQLMQSLDKLGDMIRRQQSLMDQTYRSDRGLDPNSSDSAPLSEQLMQEALRQLQQGQEGLQQSLKDLMAQLQALGMDPNGKLGQAGEAMGKAAEALGRGKTGNAVGQQGQALDALRQGAQGLTQQLANRGQGGGIRGGDNFPNQDPLGRPQSTSGPDLGNSVKVPDEIDTQRAREILDAIRKRLGGSALPDMERDYLERLLERF
jgi:uncharacterized protein (TIGR02302 family)